MSGKLPPSCGGNGYPQCAGYLTVSFGVGIISLVVCHGSSDGAGGTGVSPVYGSHHGQDARGTHQTWRLKQCRGGANP